MDLDATLRRLLGDVEHSAWERIVEAGTIRAGSAHAKRFRHFGDGSAICFPAVAMFGERYVSIGEGSVVGPYATVSAGVSPEHELGDVEVISIGDHTLIGKGSAIVGHQSIKIGNNVFTGHNVYLTDANHGYEDVDTPIGRQFAESKPVVVGDDSWLGHGSIILPGVTIGAQVVVGAGSVVTHDLPDRVVAVGNPARIVRRFVDGEWRDESGGGLAPSAPGKPPPALED
jgi:carbonic anhydrase/acetyltransferase-like protein (isoleucine patch superfamily)